MYLQAPVEDAYHYFLSCPLFNDIRVELLDNLNSMGFEINIIKILTGDPSKSSKADCIAMLIIQDYIFKTERF